jgi:hypothetical protein
MDSTALHTKRSRSPIPSFRQASRQAEVCGGRIVSYGHNAALVGVESGAGQASEEWLYKVPECPVFNDQEI